ncbi:molybdenum cofactor biosynthesis protein MoaE [Aureliella helgolandensis]|uniref:Molybdopterin synthase catalytic subunit n=1 Tax=Aureliella helgolandensis TaxID=2527968 RepID=A0A518GDH7_9BACT|nr:molybdenum cofactor biosynthesis protein MoaE [Aureliella helgolandensis]QDV26607.1 Molybdopterin synthase catalytic subunit 1 [Aureliella helgolandensis]
MVELTELPIDLNRVLESITDPECGAEVLFVGTTRQWTERLTSDGADEVETPEPSGQRVETEVLVYEAYQEMALKQLQELEQQARTRWPLRQVTIVHRLGRVAPKEASVAVAVSSPHRSEAFEAAQWLIDTLKHEVPIWKEEHYVQSGATWIHPTAGNCKCAPQEQPLPIPPE